MIRRIILVRNYVDRIRRVIGEMKLGIYDLSYKNFGFSFTKVVVFAFDYLVDVKGVLNGLILLFVGVSLHEPNVVDNPFFE